MQWSVVISPEFRHKGLPTRCWPFALNPRNFSIPFSKSPTSLFSFKIYSLVEKKRWWRRGRGSTVQQLFTEVLSSYFTRKHTLSFWNSPTGQSPTPSVLHSCRCLLHFPPFILTLWMEMPPEPPSLSPPICWFISYREEKLDPCLKEKDSVSEIQANLIQWSSWTKQMQTANTFIRSSFSFFSLSLMLSLWFV